MNLHAIVSPYVSPVNPPLLASIQPSTGYTTDANFKRVPVYGPAVNVYVDCQALQYNDIQMTAGLQIQGRRQAMYITGDYAGLVRAQEKGGDIITLPDGSVWLCAMVLERWSMTSGWVKICATLQDGS